MWLLKDMAFPDPNWQTRVTLLGGINAFLFVLGPYWAFGWLLISGTARPSYPLPEGAWHCLCISLCLFGSVLMIAADAQKYFTLRLRRGLITDGVHTYVRHPNYAGEMLIYASFALLVWHWFPAVVLAWVWLCVFAPNMALKEASMSRYPEWAAYRRRTWWLVPGVFQGSLARALPVRVLPRGHRKMGRDNNRDSDMPLQWREQLSVGNDLIDADHQHLITIINQANNSLQAMSRAGLLRALTELDKYSRVHFTLEEKIAQAVGFPDLGQLHASHMLLLETLNQIAQQLGEQWDKAAADHFGQFLRDWLINHVIKEDMLLKPYLKKYSPRFDPRV